MSERPALAAARALDLGLALRACAQVDPIDGGWVLRHPTLADVHHLNAVVLQRAPASAGALIALAEALQEGLGHRRVAIVDPAGAEPLHAPLAAAGWERERVRYMALDLPARPPSGVPAPAPDPRVSELAEAEAAALQHAVFSEQEYGRHAPGLIDRLVAAQALLRGHTVARNLAAAPGAGDPPAATCTLFCDPDAAGRRTAMLESVGTLRAHRQQGLARAACTAAIDVALAWGAESIVVPVDAEDWPQLMYASLGFRPVGDAVAYVRRV